MKEEPINNEAEAIASNIFHACIGDIEEYIKDGVFERNLVTETNDEYIKIERKCLEELSSLFSLYAFQRYSI